MLKFRVIEAIPANSPAEKILRHIWKKSFFQVSRGLKMISWNLWNPIYFQGD